MKTIWKWTLEAGPQQSLKLPRGSKMLSVQVQGDMVQLWALCDPNAEKVMCDIAIYGTGHNVPDDPGTYLGTFQVQGGALVFHAFLRSGSA